MSPEPNRLLTLIAELTYSCPLRCAYCSNPVQLERRRAAMTVEDWLDALEQAASLGTLQVHFTGGEPLLYRGLEVLVRRARELQLYTNLITSGVPLTRGRLQRLQQAGLEHVQISLQAATSAASVAIAGVDATSHKLTAARWVKELELALTINIVLHRRNMSELPELLALAEALEPHRIELANAQYLGWARLNREQLLPTAAQLDAARAQASALRERMRGKTDVLFVLPDYYTGRPRACMQGWAHSTALITPDGLLLPCHAARDLPGLEFDDVRSARLSQLWSESPALAKFRGSDWLPEPCRDCDERERDFAGCRCQAFALTGDAASADPACSLTPAHQLIKGARQRATTGISGDLVLRRAPRQVNEATAQHSSARGERGCPPQ